MRSHNAKHIVHKMRIKKGDFVRVLRGRDRGKKGKVLVSYPASPSVLVEGLNMVKKHVRPKQGQKGQRVSVSMPLRISNVQLVCPQCKKGTRVSIRIEGDTRVRVCKQCDSHIE